MMDIIIGIYIKFYGHTTPHCVLRYLGRKDGEVKWLMFIHPDPRSATFDSIDILRMYYPEASIVNKVFPAEYCPTLEEIPLEALQ